MDVIIMQNTMMLDNKNNSKMVFDIKGSTFERFTKTREMKPRPKFNKILKDNNILAVNK